MKNLLERLKPEYLELLDEHAKDYPSTVEFFKEELSSYVTWLEITFNNLLFIKRAFKVEINETEIDNLFDN
jgi:hypothetical protein